MKLKRRLNTLLRVVLEEAERNDNFRSALESAIGLSDEGPNKSGKSRGGRRTPALIDPIALVEDDGDAALRAALALLDIEQLKDVIAQFGMDHDRLALKWKDRERLEGRIIDMSLGRASKGHAFSDE